MTAIDTQPADLVAPEHFDPFERSAWFRIARGVERTRGPLDSDDLAALEVLVATLDEFRGARRVLLTFTPRNWAAATAARMQARGACRWLGLLPLDAEDPPLGDDGADEILDALADVRRPVVAAAREEIVS